MPLVSYLKKWPVPLALAATVCTFFAYTVYERHEWFGEMTQGHWLTGSTLKFARNWYRDGAVNDAFLMLENPASIEFGRTDLDKRGVYLSYPSGCIIPIHAVALLTGTEPSPALVMGYNLGIHLLIALVFAFTVYLASRRLGIGPVQTYFLSLLSAIFYLWAPYAMASHQNRYFADIAIMPLFALVVLIEVALCTEETSRRNRWILIILQHFLLALGLFTDYLFVFVYACLYFKKALLGELGRKIHTFLINSFLFSFSAVTPIALFMYQVIHFDRLDQVKDKFLFRTGQNDAGGKYVENFFEQFWQKNIETGMDTLALILVAGSVAVIVIAFVVVLYYRLRRRQRTSSPKQFTPALSLLGTCGVVTFACLLQLYFLKNHSVIHGFSALKVCFLIAIVPFGLLLPAIAGLCPVLRRYMFGRGFEIRGIYFNGKQLHTPVFLLLTVVLFIPYIHKIHESLPSYLNRPPNRDMEFGSFLNNNTDYFDIVFSDTATVRANPPTIAGLGMKFVYPARNVGQIIGKVRNLPEDARVNFLIDKKRSRLKKPIGPAAIWKNAKVIEDENLTLFQLSQKEFMQSAGG